MNARQATTEMRKEMRFTLVILAIICGCLISGALLRCGVRLRLKMSSPLTDVSMRLETEPAP